MLLFDKVLQKYYRSSRTSPVCLVMYPSLNLSLEFARLVELIRRRHLSPPSHLEFPHSHPHCALVDFIALLFKFNAFLLTM